MCDRKNRVNSIQCLYVLSELIPSTKMLLLPNLFSLKANDHGIAVLTKLSKELTVLYICGIVFR